MSLKQRNNKSQILNLIIQNFFLILIFNLSSGDNDNVTVSINLLVWLKYTVFSLKIDETYLVRHVMMTHLNAWHAMVIHILTTVHEHNDQMATSIQIRLKDD